MIYQKCNIVADPWRINKIFGFFYTNIVISVSELFLNVFKEKNLVRTT